jgi:TM2 domain-containing membrane protein YozV
MGSPSLGPGEVIVTSILAQLVNKGLPFTNGDLYLTNQRLVLVPNQVLSVGIGQHYQLRLADVLKVTTRRPFEGGPYPGMAGHRIVVQMRDGSNAIFSTLGDPMPFVTSLREQLGQPAAGPATADANMTPRGPMTTDGGAFATPDRTPRPGMVQPAVPPKDPLLAGLLSFLLAGGAGQIYLGQTKKGAIIIVATLLTLCIGVGFALWVAGVIDAVLIGRRLKAGEAVGEMRFF